MYFENVKMNIISKRNSTSQRSNTSSKNNMECRFNSELKIAQFEVKPALEEKGVPSKRGSMHFLNPKIKTIKKRGFVETAIQDSHNVKVALNPEFRKQVNITFLFF